MVIAFLCSVVSVSPYISILESVHSVRFFLARISFSRILVLEGRRLCPKILGNNEVSIIESFEFHLTMLGIHACNQGP